MNSSTVAYFSDMLKEVKVSIKAVKYCLYSDGSTPPEDILHYVSVYQGGDKEILRSILDSLLSQDLALSRGAPLECRGLSARRAY